jgi:hypothetical protein
MWFVRCLADEAGVAVIRMDLKLRLAGEVLPPNRNISTAQPTNACICSTLRG